MDNSLVSKAVDALLKHHSTKSANDLLGSEAAIHLQIGLVVAPKDPSSKHYNIELPHAIYKDISDAEVCLFVKNDETKRQIQELKEQFGDLLKPIVKIMTLDSLRSKHGEYGQRRSLMKKYTQFMVDDRILPMMPAALGRDFIKKTRLPLPIKVTRTKSLPHAIQRALKSTYYTVKGGTCVNVRVAVTSMAANDIVENIVCASRDLHLATKSIQSLCIKLPESAALPLYNQSPEQLYDVIEMARQAEEKAEEEKQATESNKEDLKSPLLKALKKQKQLEKRETKEKSKESNKAADKKSKESHEVGNSMDVDLGSTAEKRSQEASPNTKKSKKEHYGLEKTSQSEDTTTPSNKSEVAKSEKDSTKKTGTNEKLKEKIASKKDKEPATPSNDKKGKQEKGEQSKGSESGKKRKNNTEEESPSLSKKNKPTAESSVKAKFMPAKKYTGSKSGYVYKKGSEGLGYYVDIKPVVNKMALDALRRSSGQSNSTKSRKQNRGSSKSRSKSHGSSKNDSKRRR